MNSRRLMVSSQAFMIDVMISPPGKRRAVRGVNVLFEKVVLRERQAYGAERQHDHDEVDEIVFRRAIPSRRSSCG